jgi:hypothetical protein
MVVGAVGKVVIADGATLNLSSLANGNYILQEMYLKLPILTLGVEILSQHKQHLATPANWKVELGAVVLALKAVAHSL